MVGTVMAPERQTPSHCGTGAGGSVGRHIQGAGVSKIRHWCPNWRLPSGCGQVGKWRQEVKPFAEGV